MDMVKGSVRRLKKCWERWGSMGTFRLQRILQVKEMQMSAFEQLTTSEGSKPNAARRPGFLLNSTNSEEKWYGQSPCFRKQEG